MLEPNYWKKEWKIKLMGLCVLFYALYEAYINGDWHVFETCVLPSCLMAWPLMATLIVARAANIIARAASLAWRWSKCARL